MRDFNPSVTRFIQQQWNETHPKETPLVVDGDWGPATDAAVTKEWLALMFSGTEMALGAAIHNKANHPLEDLGQRFADLVDLAKGLEAS